MFTVRSGTVVSAPDFYFGGLAGHCQCLGQHKPPGTHKQSGPGTADGRPNSLGQPLFVRETHGDPKTGSNSNICPPPPAHLSGTTLSLDPDGTVAGGPRVPSEREAVDVRRTSPDLTSYGHNDGQDDKPFLRDTIQPRRNTD